MLNTYHPKLEKALLKMGEDKFSEQAESLLQKFPTHRVVLGLLGGGSTGRYGFRHTAGRKYPRPAVRYERGVGIVGIRRHSGPYLCVEI